MTCSRSMQQLFGSTCNDLGSGSYIAIVFLCLTNLFYDKTLHTQPSKSRNMTTTMLLNTKTKYYYSLFNFYLTTTLECINVFVDFLLQNHVALRRLRSPARIAAIIFNFLIIALQIPFIVVGFVMVSTRISSSSWDNRKQTLLLVMPRLNK